MNCAKCQRPMGQLHEVVERETLFVLWECACGHKLLDRKPLPPGRAPAPAPTQVSTASSSHDQD